MDLDLTRALVWLHGPSDAITRGFAALGRKPTRYPFDPASVTVDQNDGYTVESAQPYRDTTPRALADPLTGRTSPFHFVYAIAAGGSLASIEHVSGGVPSSASYAGVHVSAQLGYRRHGATRVGLRFDAASLSGPVSTLTQYDVAPFVQIPLDDPFWVGAFAGIHVDSDATDRIGTMVGVDLGLDLIPIKRHWLSVFGQYAYIMESDADYSALTFGLAYGH